MIREDVVLYADGGDMTVGRRTGVFTWGNFDVVLPEGWEQEASDQRLQDGFISRPLNRPTGRFDIGFVRADARIDLEAQTSDLEMVIDTAQKRAEGALFFERDITGRGLGRYRPGVDFNTGDIVYVEVWGKRIFQPVTAVELLVSDSEGSSGTRVHVGGQLVADAATLRRHNDALSQQIAAEKRQRLKEVGEIRETASEAKSTADTAKTTADDALSAATDADGVIQGYITEGRQHVADALGHADDARANAGNAFSEAERAVGLVDDASVIIGQAQEKLDAIPAIIESGRRWARLAAAQSASSQVFASQALVHADRADEHAQSAFRLVDDALVLVADAEIILDAANVELGKIPGIIEAGEQHVIDAKGHADRADRAVTDAGAAKAAAETALTNATNLLADIDGEGTDFPTAVTQVLGAHNDVLTKHGEVLTKHEEAITAASDAARDAGFASGDALTAAGALTDVQILHGEVLAKHGQAIKAVAGAAAQASMAAMQAAETGRLAAKAADEAGKAAGSAGEAADHALDIAGELATVQILHGEVLTKHGQAIKAAAGAAAQASMAAMQATETARSAALAADKALDAANTLTTVQGLHSETLTAHGGVLERHSEAITSAGNAAESALEAVAAAELAQEIGWEKVIATQTLTEGFVNINFETGRKTAWVIPYTAGDWPWSGEMLAKAYYVNNTVQALHSTVPMVNNLMLGGGDTEISLVEVEYRRNRAVGQRRSQTHGEWQLPSNNNWHQQRTTSPWRTTITATTKVTVLFRVVWEGAGYSGSYSLQARVNGDAVATVRNEGLGPVYVWQSGRREQVMSLSGDNALNVNQGDELTFWVIRERAGVTSDPQERKVKNFSLTVIWDEPA